MARSREVDDKRAKATEALAARQGWTLLVADRRFETLADSGLTVTDIRVRLPNDENGDYLTIIKAQGETGGVVGFGSGLTFGEALAGTLERLYNGSLRWKEDQYG